MVRRTPVIKTISLEGTMNYEKGQFAFFEGTTLKPEGTVSGFKVLSIAQSGVKLDVGTNNLQGVAMEGDTNTLELKVGYQLRREDGGPWLMAMNTASSSGGDRTSAFRSGGSRRRWVVATVGTPIPDRAQLRVPLPADRWAALEPIQTMSCSD